jgi:hypothetical protein
MEEEELRKQVELSGQLHRPAVLTPGENTSGTNLRTYRRKVRFVSCDKSQSTNAINKLRNEGIFS